MGDESMVVLAITTSPEYKMEVLSYWEDLYHLPNFDAFTVVHMIFKVTWDKGDKKENVQINCYLHGKLKKITSDESNNFITSLMSDMDRIDVGTDLPMFYDLHKSFCSTEYRCNDKEPFVPSLNPRWMGDNAKIEILKSSRTTEESKAGEYSVKCKRESRHHDKFKETTKLVLEANLENGKIYAIRFGTLISSFSILPDVFLALKENHEISQHFYSLVDIPDKECKKLQTI